MPLLCPDDDHLCLPLTIGQGDSDRGARLGGSPPQDVSPKLAAARYFVTIPLTADRKTEVSIFVAFDFDGMANASRQLLRASDGLLEVIVHEARPRAGNHLYSSELSTHPLLIHPQSPDWFISGGERLVESGHKIGGRPYLEHASLSLAQELNSAFREGFRQYLQIGFPSGANDAVVRGDWPFADGVFHLMVRQMADEQPQFSWFWDF